MLSLGDGGGCMGKTVNLITYHNALSYGGCLQALASVWVLQSLGCEVEVIDYENSYEARCKTAKGVMSQGSCREIAAFFAKRLLFRGDQYRRRAFGSVLRDYPLTPNKYKDIHEMEGIEADVLVVGSDQVWNPSITSGCDRAFYLDFGCADKRISLASSFGSHALSAEESKLVAPMLRRFSSISVRENFTRDQIESLVDVEPYVMMDPTLLVSDSRWRAFARACDAEKGPKSYILLFMVVNDSSCYGRYVESARKACGLPVLQVRLNSFHEKYVDQVIPATPREFVWLVANAALVVTDSFHGIAFSINLDTPFVFFANKGNSVRVSELVSRYGLVGREKGSDSLFRKEDVERMDAREIGRKLDVKRESDLAWLEEAIG